jgi:peptidoglycan/LPS O-acetylase OafA/YrhL
MNQASKIKIDPATSGLMDFFRGVSAMVVACVHAFQVFVLPYFGMGSRSQILTSLAATYAVNVFFIVSGFMICVSAFRHRNQDGSFQSIEFARARILRIYPPLILAIIITVCVYLTIRVFGLHGSESFRLGGEQFVARERAVLEWEALPSTFFLLYGAIPLALPPLNMDGPLWTLSYEWWFYVLTFLFARLWNGLSFSSLLPIGALLIVLLYGRNSLFLWFLLIWLSGFYLGYLYLGDQLHSDRFWLGATTIAFCLVAALLLIGRQELITKLLNPFDTSSAQKMMVVVSTFLTLVISILIRIASSCSRVPNWPRMLSDFSYTLYVLHYPLLLLSFSVLHPLLHDFGWTISLAAAMVVIVPIVYVSSRAARVVENRPLLRRLAFPRSYLAQRT